MTAPQDLASTADVVSFRVTRVHEGGVAAEDTIQLPARDTRNLDKAETEHARDVRRGRVLRDQARENDDDRNRSPTDQR